MIIKLNKFERVAGLFVLSAFVLTMSLFVSIAIKKGWFSSKVSYMIIFPSAEGLREGTDVLMSGLNIGSIDQVQLIDAKRVEVSVSILEKYQSYITEDSKAKLLRPFVIGEKAVDISIGDSKAKKVPQGGEIAFVESIDFIDLMSGKKLDSLATYLENNFSKIDILLKAFTQKERVAAFVEIFDELLPLMRNINAASREFKVVGQDLNSNKRFKKLISSLAVFSHELENFIPMLEKNGSQMSKDIPELVTNLNDLTREFKKITPAIQAIAPHLPQTSLRAVEALDEFVVLIKALQRNYFFKDKVDDIRYEELRRLPASRDKK